MRWLTRRRRFSLGHYVPEPPRPAASVDEIVDDGVMISGSAVRLAVKNRIILAAMRDRIDYSAALRPGRAKHQFVVELSERARSDAWEEIAASITVRAALSSYEPPDEAYPRERGERLLGPLDDIARLEECLRLAAESGPAPSP